MKYIKYIVIMCVLLVLLYCVYGSQMHNDVTATLKIHPAGISSEYYCINILSDGAITTQKSKQDENAILLFAKAITRKTKGLMPIERDKINTLLEDIFNNEDIWENEITEYWDDGWMIEILYNDKTVIQEYSAIKSEIIKELVDECIRLSPMKIELRSFS